jgi:nucleotide-binding universal stress UspA family protein
VAPVVVCVDGSDLALDAARSGLAVLRKAPAVLATVVEGVDRTLAHDASGLAGGVYTPDEIERIEAAQQADAGAILTAAADALDGAFDQQVLEGEPGPALCAFAEEVGAAVVVMGSRGRGGLRRAVLGSVSDYVVRHAPCPVLIARAQ